MNDFVFVKSTHSSQTGECVEVARNIPGTVAVRDSKDQSGGGPVLRLAPTAWRAFNAALQADGAAIVSRSSVCRSGVSRSSGARRAAGSAVGLGGVPKRAT